MKTSPAMNHRPLVSLIQSSALGLVAVALLWQPSPADQQRPNIILCMADDQGWGDVAYNGHPQIKTPTLDEMAASGLRFDRFYAAAPVCSPTRGSVLTGRHPNRFGCFRWGYTLRPPEVTIAEALQTAGYATGHFGKWHLGSVRRDSPVCPGNSGFDEWVSSPNFYENDAMMSHNGKAVQAQGESSQIAVDAALQFIHRAVERRQPFLAVVWFGSPHAPHVAAPENRELYRDLPEKSQHYLGEITGIDRAMKNLRRQLRQLNIADNTLLWYTSDNGAQRPGSTGGLSGFKGSLWEGGVRVPAIVEWPARIPTPRTTDLPCNTVDIYPTVLEIAGVKVAHQPRPLDGISLVSLIDGNMKSRSSPMGFWDYPAAGHPVRSAQLLEELAQQQANGTEQAPEVAPRFEGEITEQYSLTEFPGHAAWLDGRYKLHRIPNKSGGFEYALFDVVEDPQERNSLLESESARVEQMKAALEAWQKSVVNSLNGGDYAQRQQREAP